MTDHAIEYVWVMDPPIRTKGRGGPTLGDWRAECACGWKRPRRIADTVAFEDGRRHLASEQVTL